jgi:hypothetical protein
MIKQTHVELGDILIYRYYRAIFTHDCPFEGRNLIRYIV